jgi:prepilin-type N-terminal cleavage/methylation domain-containing protein
MEESGLNYPVQTNVRRGIRNDDSGFTLVEVLTALFVVGVATTIFLQLYSGSLDLSRSSTRYDVASQVAEEYMVELQVNPGQFAWPNFDGEVGTLLPIKLIDDESPLLGVSNPSAMPVTQRAYDRESNLYEEFEWHAYAKIHEADSNFVEVLVAVFWPKREGYQYFYLTSTVPRSVGEGIGL